MLRVASFDIVFQEIPGEVTFVVNLSGCPNKCPGCHSPHLQENIGETLSDSLFTSLIERYGQSVTCICFMGGDNDPGEVERLALLAKEVTGNRLKAAWYSGRQNFPDNCRWKNFDYVKLGPYIETLGGLDCGTTNQRFYRVINGEKTDITSVFLKKTSRE